LTVVVGFEQAAVVEPVDPLEGGEFEVVEAAGEVVKEAVITKARTAEAQAADLRSRRVGGGT